MMKRMPFTLKLLVTIFTLSGVATAGAAVVLAFDVASVDRWMRFQSANAAIMFVSWLAVVLWAAVHEILRHE